MLALLTILPCPRASMGVANALVRWMSPARVHLDHRVDLIEVLTLDQPAGELPGVVDQHIDPLAAELGDASVDPLARGELDANRPGLPRAALAERREVACVAHAGQEVHIALGERLHQRAADAAVGPGHENGLSGKVH
jgi:hypothetical protein